VSRLFRSKRWLLIAALSSTTAVAPGCKNGASMSTWNPFAKSGPTPNLVQSEPNSYTQPNMPPIPKAEESSWTAPFKKFGDSLSSPFKAPEKTESAKIAEKDPISLANKVAEPKASLYVQLAKVHERNGKLSEAVGEYDKALDIDAKDLSALLGLAQLYDRIGRYEEALVFYGRAAQVAPENATIQNDLGLCLARSDDMKDAAAALRRAVSLDPKKVLYRNNLATVLIELNRLDEAFETLETVHGASVAHYNVGFLLNKKNRKADALKHFEQAAALDPSLKEAQQWVAALGGKATPIGTPTSTPNKDAAPVVVAQAAPAPAATNAGTGPGAASSKHVRDSTFGEGAPVETAPTPATPVTPTPTPIPTPTPVAPPAAAQPVEAAPALSTSSPLINAELTNIPRPSIAKTAAAQAAPQAAPQPAPQPAPQLAPQPTPQVATVEAAPVAQPPRRETTFETSRPKESPTPTAPETKFPETKTPDAPAEKGQSGPTIPFAAVPRKPVTSNAAPPLPEQISSIDVPETAPAEKKASSILAKSSKPAVEASAAKPKFPASRY
jgi:tetratricopeptide (TPR) repeat protein